MLCSKCMQREANVFFSKITNGVKEEYKVCDVCAKELGLIGSSGVMLNMNDFISDFVGKGIGRKTIGTSLVCKACGCTLSEFSKTSKFGCAECYNTFKNHLAPLMKRLHGNAVHTGKFPEKAESINLKKNKLIELKTKMAKAVETEDFETAAKLRDEIKELSKEIDGQEG